ncbi:MAG: Fe-S protein assembly co-chaperone HscB [Candidatus Thioglobus sp.]|nr:Fe-S protein assembly co-chaperone HscB [Candidatus Thioglobus sp.]
MQNYFDLFAIKTQFSIDLAKLESSYQAQIGKFHPDKFSTKSAKEKSAALQNSALINEAYATLKSALPRATYLLKLQGINAFDEKNTQMNADFLIQQIEFQEQLEQIESAKNEPELYDFIELISGKIQQNIKQIQLLFSNNSNNGLDEITNLVRELKFYQQLNAHAKQFADEWL